ncbi:MAG: MFS transporter [Ktedonobacteraceae bacterium]|nr:MFS transporter [Ktedonobacteraceae bacterium]
MRNILGKSRFNTLYTPAMLALVLIVGISFLGLGFIMPLRALYGREVGASSVEIALMTSVFLLTGFLSAPFIGWLSDRFGHRRVLWIGLLAHTFLMLAYIPAQNPILLIVLRGLEGIASASVLPPARAMVNVIAPSTRQGEALGMLSATQAGGILLGPVVGSLMASQTGYTLSFVLASAVLALSIFATLLLPAPKAAKEHTGALEVPVTLKGLFTRQLLLAYLLQLILQVTQGVISAIWVLYMADHGASLPEIGLSFTTFAIPLMVLTPFMGRLSDRYGRYWLAVLGVLCFGIIFCIYGWLNTPFWLIVLSVAEGSSAAIVRGSLDGLLADVTPANVKGKVQANFTAAGTFGSFLGATLAGVLYGVKAEAPFISAGVLCLLTVCMLFWPGIVRLFPVRYGVVSERATLRPE